MNQQSVIVNFNPNFANGSASDFIQPFNKQLEIEPNAEVALYQGNLQRKTVVLPRDETIEIDFTEQLPSLEARENAKAGGIFEDRIDSLRPPQENLTFNIPKGNYTQSELIEEIRTKMSNVIIQQRKDYFNNPVVIGAPENRDLMYEAIGENDEDGVFIGLAPLNRFNTVYYQSTANVGTEVIQNKTTFLPAQRIINPTVNADNWNQFASPGLPMNPLSAIQSSSIIKQEDQQCAFFYDVQFNRKVDTNQRIYVGFLNSALTSNLWIDPTEPEVIGATGFTTIDEGLPTSFFGIHHQFETDSSNNSVMTTSIYINGDLDIQSSISDEYNEFKVQYSKIKLADPQNDGFRFMNANMLQTYKYQVVSNEDIAPNDSTTFGVRLYSVAEKVGENTNEETQESRKYFFQVLGKDANSQTSFYSGVDNVIFDSKNFGMSLPQDVVEDACFCRNFVSYRDGVELQDLGLEPYMFFRNCEVTSGIYNPRGTYIKSSFDTNSEIMINTPIVRYQFNYQKDSVLKLVLGGGKSYSSIKNKAGKNEVGTSYDPNLYPQQRGQSAGVNALYSDNQRYNFEILSLPIRTFNSTKTSMNVSGNERSILHSTDTFIDGEVTELTNSLINKNVVPSTLKYLSLRNSAPIRLNDINVKITRADTNETADEITDCSFEMLIRSPK